MDNEERMDFWISAERNLTADEFRILRYLHYGYTYRDITGMTTHSLGGVFNKVQKLKEKLNKTL